ncbi:MAG TPA: HTTM domain-containing protein [Kofleriaceae bacterium]|jgi:hypothetical protein
MRSVIGDPELRPLGAARAAFGLVMLLRTTPLLAAFDPQFLRGTNGWLGWPDSGWHVPVLGLTLPAFVVVLLVVARTLAAVCLMLGFHSRVAGLVAGVAGYLVLAQDAFGYFHHLHMLYLGAILFAVVDADAALAVRVSPAKSARSSLGLMRVFVASIYLWAAVGKIASEWGTGAALAMFKTSGALDRVAWLLTPGRYAAIEIGVIAMELAIGLGLLLSRTRRLVLVCAVLLHLTFEAVARVDTIGWQMCALLLVFTRSGPPRPATP